MQVAFGSLSARLGLVHLVFWGGILNLGKQSVVDVSKIVVGAWLHNDSALAPRLKGPGSAPEAIMRIPSLRLGLKVLLLDWR